jgi:hypothetical protein
MQWLNFQQLVKPVTHKLRGHLQLLTTMDFTSRFIRVSIVISGILVQNAIQTHQILRFSHVLQVVTLNQPQIATTKKLADTVITAMHVIAVTPMVVAIKRLIKELSEKTLNNNNEISDTVSFCFYPVVVKFKGTIH